MILDFAQGIVRHATTTGSPGDPQNFLQTVSSLSDRVDINAPLDQPLVLSASDRDAYYYLTISIDGGTINAWGYGQAGSNNAPMVAGQGSGSNKDEFYLYVDVNKATGQVSYGYTKYNLVSGTQPPFVSNPQSRPNDQHWFDTTENLMKVWRKTTSSMVSSPSSLLTAYGAFANVVRVFIAKYKIGSGPSAFVSISNNSPSYLGTQAGLLATGSSPNSTGYRTGALMFDVNGKPFKRSSSNGSNTFFTTEDLFTTQLPTSTRIRIESFVVDGIAQTNMDAYTIVQFTDFHEIMPLSPNLQDSGLFGIIEEETVVGRLTKVAIDGVVTNHEWNWTEVNQPLYANDSGAIVRNPVIADQVPIAFVLDKTTIVLRPARVAVGEVVGAKMDKVTGITGNLVEINPNGNVVDTGIASSDVITSSISYDLTYFISGNPSTDSTLGSIIVSRDVKIMNGVSSPYGGSPIGSPAGSPVGPVLNAFAYAETPAVASKTIFDIFLNNSSTPVGYVIFPIGNPDGTIVVKTNINMVKGDRLKIASKSTVDASLSDISITIPSCMSVEKCSL